MKNPSTWFLSFLIISGIGATMAAEPSKKIHELTGVVQAVTERSPAVKGAASRVKETQGGVKEIRSMNWPKLSWLSSVTRGDNPVYVFGSLLEQAQFGPQNFAIDSLNNPDYLTNYKNALVLGVPIFTGMELHSNEKILKLQTEQSQFQWEGALQNSRLQAIDAYLQVLMSKALLNIANERIESSQAEVESARKLNARGLVLGSDFYAAQAILSGLETQKIQIEKRLEAATESLAILMGTPVSEIQLEGKLSEVPYPIDSDDQILAKAMAHRPDLKQAHQQVAIAGVSTQQSTRSFWPKVEAFASLETNTEDFSSNPTNRMIGLKSDFPLGDPTYFSKKDKSRAQIDEATSYQATVEDQARMEIYGVLRRYQGVAASLPQSKDTREKAQKSLELFRPLYREGRQSIIEVLRAEEGLMRAASGYVEMLYQVHANYAQLQFVTGSLDDEAVARMNQQLVTP